MRPVEPIADDIPAIWDGEAVGISHSPISDTPERSRLTWIATTIRGVGCGGGVEQVILAPGGSYTSRYRCLR